MNVYAERSRKWKIWDKGPSYLELKLHTEVCFQESLTNAYRFPLSPMPKI